MNEKNSNEMVNKNNLDNLDRKIESKGGLYDALESSDKILLLDFSGSMDITFEGKKLYQHLIDAVRQYEREYTMIRFDDEAKVIIGIDNEKPGGWTQLVPALRMAYGKGDSNYEYIVVSDGLPADTKESLKYAMDNKMKISTIFLGDNEQGRSFMAQLARLTGGKSDNIKLLKGFGGMLEKKIAGLIEG
jgi:hypothetical protein